MAARPFQVTILADDLTGACDTGCLFAGAGAVGVTAAPLLVADDRAVLAVDTGSRALAPPAAAEAVHAAARALGGRLDAGVTFKKIDSTMRGHVAVELDALLEQGSRFTGALVCPAFPAQRRVVSQGRLLVDGVPLHESSIARDPALRGGSAELSALLDGSRRVVRLGLDDVRAGHEKIAHVLEQHPGALFASDAETDADLASLAAAALAVPGTLAAGAAGLGRALALALGLAAPPAPLPPGPARLVVVGSLHPASRAQVDALARRGVAVVTVDDVGGDPDSAIEALRGGRPAVVTSGTATISRRPAARGAIARQLARAAARVIAGARPDLVAVTGGDTARALLEALRPRRFDLLGVPADGLALGRLALAAGDSLPLLTKAGGFGEPDLFTTLLGGTS
jgi:D-threonate/D-erythronate kinase